MNWKRNRFWHIICLSGMILITVAGAYPQSGIPIGTWRSHIAHNRAVMIQQIQDEIYCISESGLFIYNKTDNDLQVLSRINGLSDVSITAIHSGWDPHLLVLGYENGNVDFIRDQEIYNLTDIKNADLAYPKSVIDIASRNQQIYFIIGFGVVVFDTDQNAVKETWQNLGESGDFLQITGGKILGDSIFLSTGNGVIAGDLKPGNNLLDYRNWKRFGSGDGLPAAYTRDIGSNGNDLYILQSENEIYKYDNGRWDRVYEEISGKIISVKSGDASVTFSLSDRVYVVSDPQPLSEIMDDQFLSLQEAIFTGDELYAADYINGLIRVRPEYSEVIRPSGPFSNDVFRIYNYEEIIIAVPKGYNQQIQPLRNNDGFYFFKDGKWDNFNNSGGAGYFPIPEIMDLVDMTYHPDSKNVYFASAGYGLLEWDQDSDFRVYNETDPNVTLINSNPPDPFTIVPALDIDKHGDLWMSNYNTSLPLHRFQLPETWQSTSSSLIGTTAITDLIVTGDDNIWMVLDASYGGGIIVYNEETGETRRLSSQSGNGGLPADKVTAIIEDMEDWVWVGTTNGIAYFPFPFLIFDDPEIDAIRPLYENNFLFRNELITSIAVDGGNRKWVGTRKGAWLFSEDCTELVNDFHFVNSPLLSDSIVDIEINQATGEVFFGTSKGLISYRGDAVKAKEGLTTVKIFPNPVTPDFNGILGIEGLPQNSVVKITDIAGNLVFETTSQGGMATWNVLDKSGNRPSTGIYLVFSSREDGSETIVGKLAIIR